MTSYTVKCRESIFLEYVNKSYYTEFHQILSLNGAGEHFSKNLANILPPKDCQKFDSFLAIFTREKNLQIESKWSETRKKKHETVDTSLAAANGGFDRFYL